MASTLQRLGATLCVPLALAMSGCVASFQTTQPYTPAEGVNTQVDAMKVRNLLVIADPTGKGVISASLVSYADDTLTAVAGTPLKTDGTPGSALTVTSTGLPLTLPANTLFVLTDPPTRIAVSSPDLEAGLLAKLTLTFAKAGPVTIVAPVRPSSDPEFSGIVVGG
ncbi:hypothetical protein [Micropruina sp.]|uniref:hypothetical protein n=1 Tax=Micropruina sp. TaxID=2737536 RepID=UPI0039E6848A